MYVGAEFSHFGYTGATCRAGQTPELWVPPPEFLISRFGWGLRMYLPKKFLGDADAAGQAAAPSSETSYDGRKPCP